MPPATDRRRRKKARITSYSSSESESSSSENEVSHNSEPSELSELSDASISDDDSNQQSTSNYEEPRELLHKAPHNTPAPEFNQQFLHLVTEQFGEELSKLREANDFGPASIPQLVAGLKQGIDIFNPEQQALLNQN